MIIRDDIPKMVERLKSGEDTLKFVAIRDKFYAIVMEDLIGSKDFQSLDIDRVIIKQTLLDSFPPPRQSIDYVTHSLLKQMPVIMFETAAYDDLYFRFDGRHRMLGAYYKLGLKQVPAKFVPRNTWGKFILGYNYLTYAKPMKWDRPPNLEPDQESYHFEPNYIIHDLDAINKQREEEAKIAVWNMHVRSNSGQSILFGSGKNTIRSPSDILLK